jgi:L,D-transpeptidase ErfK/SrfK
MLLLRGLLLLFAALLLSACSGLFDALESGVVHQAIGSPPIVSDRFLLTSEDQRVVGQIQIIEARYEDTFVDIARTYNLGFDELVEANPDVDPWLPGEGTRVVLPTQFILPEAGQTGIVINIASKRLFYFLPPDEDGARAVVTHPIGIGREGAATPTGITAVKSKGRDPVWWPTASIRREYAAEGNPLPPQVMPGPDNPLGKFVLVLEMPSYLIHGTNKPAGVGMRVSHGCVRLFPENIEALFEMVPVGEQVSLVNQPYLLAWHEGRLLLEAHAPLQDDQRDIAKLLTQRLTELEVATGLQDIADQQRVAAIRDAAMGVPLPVLVAAPDPDAVLAAAPQVNNLVAHLGEDDAL